MALYLLGLLVLVIVGVVLHSILFMNVTVGHPKNLQCLNAEQSAVYAAVAKVLETKLAILGVSLNDAVAESNAGHREVAWRLVMLSASEWDRLMQRLTALLDAIEKNAPHSYTFVPYPGLVKRRFKSRTMTDFLRMYELLDQLVFRSKLRFQLQLHILRKAAAVLSRELERACQYSERTGDWPAALWQRLDIFGHDFDLVCKEALMALRAFLVCLPEASLATFAADLEPVLRRVERTASVSANR